MLALALTAYTLPLVLELLILSAAALLPGRRLPARSLPAAPGQPFRLAVLIPAHNEEQLIEACIQSLAPAEVHVVAHNCTDATAARAAAAGASVLPLTGPGGKGAALRHGFTQILATGAHAILIVDADSTVSPGLPTHVTAALAAGSPALQCRYTASHAASNPRTALMALALTGMNIVRPRGRARLGLSAGIFGNGFALTADTLRRVPYAADSVVEDVEYHLLLLRAGLRVDFLDTTTVFGELPIATPAASTQRARWEGGRILMRRQWTRPLAVAVVRGRIRLLEPLLDLLSLPLAKAAAVLIVLLLLTPWAHLAWLNIYLTLSFLAIVLYLTASIQLSQHPAAARKALLSVPGYLLWKLTLGRQTRAAAQRDATWTRTMRNPAASPYTAPGGATQDFSAELPRPSQPRRNP